MGGSCHVFSSSCCSFLRFGQPFVLHLEKTIPWDLLQKEILEKMQYFLRPSACIQVWAPPFGPWAWSKEGELVSRSLTKCNRTAYRFNWHY